ncbi:MAG: chorismate mutase [Actinomycetota bacterium]|jgi:chorismate mutase|nr:chorismate mutase [Actinomycetota bacterium]
MDQQRWACRGARGAITTVGSTDDAIEDATKTLLEGLVAANDCPLEEIAAAIFTVPDELAGCNPSAAARKHGWSGVPLLTVREQAGDSPVDRCLRVLLLLNTTRAQHEIRHLYLGDAAVLRPDLSSTPIGAET